MSGDCGHAELNYFVRDHDKHFFEGRKNTLRLIEKDLNEKWGEGTVKLTITDQYKNMAEIIADCMHLIDNAKTACEKAGVTPLVLPIRGGTERSFTYNENQGSLYDVTNGFSWTKVE